MRRRAQRHAHATSGGRAPAARAPCRVRGRAPVRGSTTRRPRPSRHHRRRRRRRHCRRPRPGPGPTCRTCNERTTINNLYDFQ